MLKGEGLKEPPRDFIVFARKPVSEEQRKQLYNAFDATIDVFLEKIAEEPEDDE